MAITKQDILAAADALDAEGVKPTLAAVRKKLGDNPQQPTLIETESGIGYRFIGS